MLTRRDSPSLATKPEADRCATPSTRAPRARRRERLGASARATRACAAPCSRRAAESKRRGRATSSAFSRNVFIPLTNLCRDRCAYCTFAKQPRLARGARPTRSRRSREVTRGGVAHGLHRGALLSRRQARARLPRATATGSPRAATRSTAEYLVEALPRRRSRAACSRTPTPASSRSKRWRRCGAGTRRWG